MSKVRTVKVFKILTSKQNKDFRSKIKPELLFCTGIFNSSTELKILELLNHFLKVTSDVKNIFSNFDFQTICLNLICKFSYNRSPALYIHSANKLKEISSKEYNFKNFNHQMIESFSRIYINPKGQDIDFLKILRIINLVQEIEKLKSQFGNIKIKQVKKSYKEYDDCVDKFIQIVQKKDEISLLVKQILPFKFNATIKFIDRLFLGEYCGYRKN